MLVLLSGNATRLCSCVGQHVCSLVVILVSLSRLVISGGYLYVVVLVVITLKVLGKIDGMISMLTSG